MTCWLNACRSAIVVEAWARRAPADRTPSASSQLKIATRKNPATFTATMNRAAEGAGRTSSADPSHGWFRNPDAARYSILA